MDFNEYQRLAHRTSSFHGDDTGSQPHYVMAALGLTGEAGEAADLIAVIHRDGGHHTGKHGLSQSVADAHATWAVVVRERDEARAEVERLRGALAQAQRADE